MSAFCRCFWPGELPMVPRACRGPWESVPPCAPASGRARPNPSIACVHARRGRSTVSPNPSIACVRARWGRSTVSPNPTNACVHARWGRSTVSPRWLSPPLLLGLHVGNVSVCLLPA